MPINDVTIANMALARIGARAKLQSLSEPTNEASTCKLQYDTVRQEVLEAHDWWFARRMATLALIPNAEVAGWSFAYQIPSDVLAIRGILPTNHRDVILKYDLAAETIYCDVEEATLIYTIDVTDVSKMSPAFREAFAWKLGFGICGPLGLPVGRQQNAYLEYDKAMSRAAATVHNQEVNDINRADPDWLTARGGIPTLPEVER